jgi:hypothetical protein
LTLHVAAGASLVAAGALLAFAPGAVLAWRTLAVAGGGLGVLAFVLAWNGRTTHLGEQGIYGAAASLAVFIAGLALADHVV